MNATAVPDAAQFFSECVMGMQQSKVHWQEAEVALVRRSRLKVQLQDAYTGPAPVISSALASTACASLRVEGLLEEFNKILKTGYTVHTEGLVQQLQSCIDQGWVFGTAYGRLRPYWGRPELFPRVSAILDRAEAEDAQMRQQALDGETNRIVKPHTPPRRIWDLYANRVLSWWVVRPRKEDVWVVSHSWREPELRHDETTPINGGQWPVPIPNETTLEHVRSELLNYGAQYAWLDVLCLRQEGDPRMEGVRLEEWKLDVPTIGYVYKGQTNVVTYFCGLGLPFHTGDLHHKRHWLNRAWTLQEINANPYIGGLETVEHSAGRLDGVKEGRKDHSDAGGGGGGDDDAFFETLAQAVHFVSTDFDVFAVLKRMRARAADHALDNVAGLAYILKSNHLPAYIRGQDLEDAWVGLVDSMDARYRAELFFLYPGRGKGAHAWMPSWEQIRTVVNLPRPGRQGIDRKEGGYVSCHDGTYQFKGLRIKGCRIEGLGEEDTQGRCRHGRVSVRSEQGVEHIMEVTAHHQKKVPDTHHHDYVLLGTSDCHHWVVGRMVGPGKFNKVSVLRVESEEERDKIKGLAHSRIMDLV